MKLEVFCVQCGGVNGHPAAVAEALQYHKGELSHKGDVFQVWDVCRPCCEDLEVHGPREDA